MQLLVINRRCLMNRPLLKGPILGKTDKNKSFLLGKVAYFGDFTLEKWQKQPNFALEKWHYIL